MSWEQGYVMEFWQRTRRNVAAIALCVGVVACDSGPSEDRGRTFGATAPPAPPSNPFGERLVPNEPGTIVERPGGGRFIVDASHGGHANELRLAGLFFGRLVDVYSLEDSGERVLEHKRFVIGPGLQSDGVDYLLEPDPFTGVESLTILHEFGTDPYLAALAAADAALAPIQDVGLALDGIFTMVPRNAALVLRLDDLLDASLVSAETVKLLVGAPPLVPFEAQVFADENHGDLAVFGNGIEFFPTRVIVDPTVSSFEALGLANPLPLNPLGFPASLQVFLANLALRVPTSEDPVALQETILRNPSGQPLATDANGTIDFSTPTQDLVRHMRAGGYSLGTGDPENGFLPDQTPPSIVGSQRISITQTPVPDAASANPRDFILPEVVFETVFCAQTPSVGEVIIQGPVFARITGVPAPHQNGVLDDLRVRLIRYPAAWDDPGQSGPLEWLGSAVGPAGFFSLLDPVDDVGRFACFVEVSPPPADPAQPSAGLATASTFRVRFSEPMESGSLLPYDSLVLTRKPFIGDLETEGTDFVIGALQSSLDLRAATFVPELPLAHQGPGAPGGPAAESYFLSVLSDDDGPTDLAGNAVATPVRVTFTVQDSAATETNGGRVSRFVAQDEDFPFGDPGTGPLPEWTGQHLYDLARELIRPRPVLHFQAVVDDNQLLPSLMTPLTAGVQTPLSSLGSKMQNVWRYADAGFALTDPTGHNLDIEGLYWSPDSGLVAADSFDEFEIRLAHSRWLPDEYIDPASLFPLWFQSGLKETFANNDLVAHPQEVVHSKELGYFVNPGDLTVTALGTPLVPFPLNLTVAPQDFTYYTWRDTAIQSRAAKNGGGAELWQTRAALGLQLPPCANGQTLQLYSATQVASIGLPLLAEFRCYPDDGALGLNSLDVSLAANSSSRPYFRAWSTGGVDQGGVVQTVDPDLEDVANGGFNPFSNPPGANLPGLDNAFYTGAMDLVVRVSRSYSIWFQTVGPVNPPTGTYLSLRTPEYTQASILPSAEDQPAGTEVVAAFRSATVVQPAAALQDANQLDVYGDYYVEGLIPSCGAGLRDSDFANTGIVFLDDDESWRDDPAAVSGAEYYQVRLTFISNPVTGQTAEVSSFALAWEE